jgi:hypothetical protein
MRRERRSIYELCFFLFYVYVDHPMKEGTKWVRDRSMGRRKEYNYVHTHMYVLLKDRSMNEMT